MTNLLWLTYRLLTGSSHGLRVFDVQALSTEAKQAARVDNNQGRGGNRTGISHGRPPCPAAGHELRTDVGVHRIRC